MVEVVVSPLGVRIKPVGSAPALMDHEYGAIPPDAVHAAEYMMLAVVGPAVGVHETESICPDASRGRNKNSGTSSKPKIRNTLLLKRI